MSAHRGARRVLVGGSFLVTVATGLAVVVMLNWLAARHYRRFDWTSSHVYSISEQTRAVLAKLDRPLSIVIFLPSSGQQRSPVFDEVLELADRYAAGSPSKVHVEVVDPLRNQLRARQVAEKYKLQRASTIVLEYGEGESARRHYVEESSLAEFDYGPVAFGEPPKVEAFKGEEVFTSAIRGLLQDRKPRVVFMAGHGEPSYKGAEMQDLRAAAEALRRENYEVEEWTSLAAEKVLDGTDVLVISSPKKPLLPNEEKAVEAYLEGGGRLLALLDPVFGDGGYTSMTRTGLEPLLAKWGVTVDDTVVVDPEASLPMFGDDVLFANRFGVHPITSGLSLPVILPLARSVRPGAAPAGYEVVPIVETSPQGWAETNLAGLPKISREDQADGNVPADISGPVPVAVAVGARAPKRNEILEGLAEDAKKAAAAAKARIVVYGDSEFASNQFFPRNSPHFLSSIAWLASRDESLGIAPKKSGKIALQLAPVQLRTIALIVLLLLPGSAVLAGLAVWWRRRN